MDMNNICVTCLGTDRTLITLKHSGVFSMLQYLLIEKGFNDIRTTSEVCLECIEQLNDVRKFQDKAYDSLQRLQEHCYKVEVDEIKQLEIISNSNEKSLNICEEKANIQLAIANFCEEKANICEKNLNIDDGIPNISEEIPHNHEEMIKFEKYEDISFLEDILDISRKNIPGDGVDSKASLSADIGTNEVKETASNVNKDVQKNRFWISLLERTPQIRFKEFASIKEGTQVNTDTAPPPPEPDKETPSEPPWKVKIFTDEELKSYRNTQLNKENYLKKPFKCTTCISSFWCDLDFENHNKRFHDESKCPYMCDVCKCRYREENRSKQCTANHYSQYKCTKCDFYSKNLRTINCHIKKRHRYGDFKCRKCGDEFNTYSQLLEHYKVVHRRCYKCNICSTQYYSYSSYATHSLIHNGDVNCSKCQKSFRSISYLRKHMKDVHFEKSVYCEVCKRYYISAAVYRMHLKRNSRHITDDMMRFECNYCHRKFNEKKDLRKHIIVVHLKIYDYKCELCHKLFAAKSYLKAHLNKVHDPNHVKPLKYICHLCGNGFLTKILLKNHSEEHTSVLTAGSSE